MHIVLNIWYIKTLAPRCSDGPPWRCEHVTLTPTLTSPCHYNWCLDPHHAFVFVNEFEHEKIISQFVRSILMLWPNWQQSVEEWQKIPYLNYFVLLKIWNSVYSWLLVFSFIQSLTLYDVYMWILLRQRLRLNSTFMTSFCLQQVNAGCTLGAFRGPSAVRARVRREIIFWKL